MIEKKLDLSIEEIENMGHSEIDRHIAKMHGLNRLLVKRSHIGLLNSHNPILPMTHMRKIDKELKAFLEK